MNRSQSFNFMNDTPTLEIVRDSEIGATIKHTSLSIPQQLAAAASACEAHFGKDGTQRILAAAGLEAGGLAAMPSLFFSLGFATGSGRAKGPITTSTVTASIGGKASPVVFAAKPVKKDFPAMVRELEASGLSKSAAVSAAVKTCPNEHRDWLAAGGGSKL